MSDDEGIPKAGLGPRSKSVSSPTSKRAPARHLQAAEMDAAREVEKPASDVPSVQGDETPPTESLGARSRSVPSMPFPGAKTKQDLEDDAPLENEWTIWFDKSSARKQSKGKPTMYEDCIMELGTFNTLAEYKKYEICLKVQNLKDHCNLRVFRKGIKPLWEDSKNKMGGKWVVRGVPKANREQLWTRMITALITESLEDNSSDQVCGVVLSTRDTGDSMQLWKDGGSDDVLETPEQRAARESRPSTDVMLKHLLFPDCDEPHTTFIYQTHSELQQPAAGGAKDKAEDTVVPTGSSNATPQTSPPRQSQRSSPTTSPPNSKKEKDKKPPQQKQPAQQRQGQDNQTQQPQQQSQQQQQQNLAAGIMPGMLPGMLSLGGTMIPMIPPGGIPGHNLFEMNAQSYAGMMHGGASGNQVGQHAQQQAAASSWSYQDAGSPDDDDDDDFPIGDGKGVSEPVRIIQERAKQIRTVRKKIRYINFFLTRQCKGRELTPTEKQKVKTLPFLQKELDLLEATQEKEVEQQKRLLGVESLEFLRKPQQPMSYANESERRFKTMRAIRKKIRFIHYHLERQRQGKVLSPAETAKVQALPDFERRLLELEAEEAKATEAAGGAVAAGGDAANNSSFQMGVSGQGNFADANNLLGSSLLNGNEFGASFVGTNPSSAVGVPDTFFGSKADAPAGAAGAAAAPQPAYNAASGNNAFMGNMVGQNFPNALQQPAQQGSFNAEMFNNNVGGLGVNNGLGMAGIGLGQGSPQALPNAKPQQLQQPQLPGALQTQAGSPELPLQTQPGGGSSAILSQLQAQIEAQRRELHEKQKHIDFLMRTQGGNPANLYLSPGPPPLDSPNTLIGGGGPMSPVGGLPPHRLPLVADPNQNHYGALMNASVPAV